MGETKLTALDKINIFKRDLKESERLYSEGKFTEAYNMLKHASKELIKNYPI